MATIWKLIEQEDLRVALREVATTVRKGESVFSGDGWTEEEKARWEFRWDQEDKERRKVLRRDV